MEDYKQQDLGCKEDNSAADMKLDFTYGSDLSSAACEDSHKAGSGLMSQHNLHMVQSSAVELNWKIASVKSVWEDNESKQSPQADVNAAFPPQHSGSSAHFTVPDASSSPVSNQGGYCKTVVSSGPGSGGGVDNSGVECVQSGGGADQSPATVAELMYGAGVPRSLQQQQQQQQQYHNHMMYNNPGNNQGGNFNQRF
uniref:Uncharacterized protein n=1 Tax=Cacopsylla melanoneura TaxID=428564 RepID=A0A8D8TFK3_9HEMI